VTITTLTWVSVFPFTELSGIVLAMVLTALFATTAIAHTYYTYRNRLGSEGKPI